MAESCEVAAFQACYSILQKGVQNELGDIVPKLYAKKLVSPDNRDDALNLMVTEHSRAAKLLAVLDTKIRTGSAFFYQILEELDSCPTLQVPVATLRRELEQVKGDRERQQVPPTEEVHGASTSPTTSSQPTNVTPRTLGHRKDESGAGTDHPHHAMSVVAKQVDEFEGRFSSLVSSLWSEMVKEEVPVNEFQQSITFLPLDIRKDHFEYIKDHIGIFKEAKDIIELFMHLNLYWTFFDYALLQHFIKRHGSKKLKEEMEKYVDDFKGFRKKTSVGQLLEVFPEGLQSGEPPPHFSQIKCELDREVSEYTLEELDNLRYRLCREYSLPEFAFKLASIQESCVIIIWRIPSSEVHCFDKPTIQWNSISTKLIQFEVDGLLKFSSKFNDQTVEIQGLVSPQGVIQRGVMSFNAQVNPPFESLNCNDYLEASCFNKYYRVVQTADPHTSVLLIGKSNPNKLIFPMSTVSIDTKSEAIPPREERCFFERDRSSAQLEKELSFRGLTFLSEAVHTHQYPDKIFGELLEKAISVYGIDKVKEALPSDLADALSHTVVNECGIHFNKSTSYDELIRKFSNRLLNMLVNMYRLPDGTPIYTESRVSVAGTKSRNSTQTIQRYKPCRSSDIYRQVLEFKSQDAPSQFHCSLEFPVPVLELNPIICLTCRPEPSLLGEKISALESLKKQTGKPALQTTFQPMLEASSALHAGDYTAMCSYPTLEDHSSLHLPSRDHVAVIFGKGVALFKKGKLKEAAKQFAHCEEEATKARCLGDAAICHVYLGDINFAKQSYQQASKHYNRAVELYSQKCVSLEWYRMSIPTISAIQAKCGSSYRNAHQVASAVKTYKKAIANAKSSKDRLSAHTSLGNLYQSLGENKAAMAEYDESIRLATELRDYVSLGWAHCNVGNAYLGLFQKDKALHHLEKSLQLALEHEPTPQAIGRAYNNIGTAYQAMSNLDKAEEYYRLALNQAVYGRDTAGQARAYGNLGNVLMIQKKYDKAIPHYTEVLSLSKDRSTVSTAYHNRGCAYYEWAESMKKQLPLKTYTGELKETESLLRKSKGPSPTTASGQKFHIPLAKESVSLDLPSPPKTTVYYYGPDAADCGECNRPPVIPDSILKLYEKGCKDLKQVVRFHEETLESIKGSTKGLSLSVSLFETNARTFHRLQDCLVNLNRWQEALLVAEQSRARALGELLLNKKVVQQPPSSPLTLVRVLDSIVMQQSCPVIYLSYTGARLLGWVLVPKRNKVTVNMFHVPLEDIQFDGKPFDYHLRYSLSELLVERSFEMYTPFDYKSETNKPVANLYDIIGQPMCSLLKKVSKERDTVQKVAIVPDSYTSLLPFTCFLETGGSAIHNSFLGDDYCFQIMPSLLSMSIMNQLPPTEVCIPADSRNICVVGNPSIPPFVYNGEQWNLGRLPFATKEAEWVSHILGATPILQEQATKSAVLMRIINSKVIHLATHGSATAGFLAFAAMTSSFSWEAVDSKSVLVYPEEIEKQNISPALVVLSSCDSGRGQVKADGMARAFILAGAQSVLTTLWRVPDESACMFMQFFYQYLVDGLRGSEALQKSALSLRCFKKYSQYIHWSGFQLTGKEIRFDVTKPTLLKALDARLGTCTIFPRLEVVKQLESSLITNPHSPTVVHVLRGNSGVKPSEALLNFIHSFHEHFKGGIFWINCRNQALVDASVEDIETAIGTAFPNIPVSESQQVLVVFDNIDHLPKLPEGSDSVLKSHNTHIVVVSKHSLPPDQLVREVDYQLLRGSSIIDIEPLSTVHSTQRVVHSVLSEHHLAPKNEEQEVFERLAEFMCGSPVIIDLVSALLLHKMNRTEKQTSEVLIEFSEDISLNEIEYTPSQTAAVLSERPLLHRIAKAREIPDEIRPEIERTMPQSSIDSPYSTSAPDSWVVITRLIDQCSLSSDEQMLLNCLSFFGCCPVPMTVVSELSLLICRASQQQPLSGSLHSKLLQLRLLQRYPTPLIYHPTLDSRKPPGNDPEFVYVPQYISDCLCKDSMTPEDKLMAIGSAYRVLSAFPKSIRDKPNFLCGSAVILRQFCDNNFELVGIECYRLVCNLELQLLPQ